MASVEYDKQATVRGPIKSHTLVINFGQNVTSFELNPLGLLIVILKYFTECDLNRGNKIEPSTVLKIEPRFRE